MADEPQALAIDPQLLTFKCLELCPDQIPCTLPTPFPVPGGTAQQATTPDTTTQRATVGTR